MSGPERKGRIGRIGDDFPLVLRDERGAPLDEDALAHEISDKGFKAETHGELQKGQDLRFRIQLRGGRAVSGRARVVWLEPTDLALWAGLEYVRLSWSDRRRLRRFTHPGDEVWSAIFEKTLRAALWTAAALLLWGALTSYLWRSLMWDMAPKVVAAAALWWALRVLLRRRS